VRRLALVGGDSTQMPETHPHNHDGAAAAPASHATSTAGQNQGRLLVVLGLTSAYVVAEVAGGLLTHSLALLADAGHLFTDALGLGLALAAIRFAQRPATSQKTYGFYRTEILAALANGMILRGASAYILFEAWQRLRQPPAVDALPMLIVACGGLLVTLVGVKLLHAGSGESLNVRGAFLEVLSDLFGAVGTIAAALVLLSTGWPYADVIASVFIGVLILPRAWGLLRSVVDVLLESAPPGMRVEEIQTAARPMSRPAATSLGYWTPACTREVTPHRPYGGVPRLIRREVSSTSAAAPAAAQESGLTDLLRPLLAAHPWLRDRHWGRGGWRRRCSATRHREGFRHGAAVNQVRQGVPLSEVQRQPGHARIDTTTVYTKLAARDPLAVQAGAEW
jgi:cobalt-zinc-cadmium efflux system protein